MPRNCFSSQTCDTGDGSREVNSNNIPPVVASSAPGNAGILAAAQNFTIANSQFFDVHGNYVVCDYCAVVKISIIMITISKSAILQFLLK